MKWIGRRQSDNVEDRRGMSTGGKAVAGGGIIGVIILLLNLFGGENAQMLTPVLEQFNNQQQTTNVDSQPLTEAQIQEGAFIKTLVADNEEAWTKIFEENGQTFEAAKLVLFTNQVQTACGGATSASGPFYCPGDRKIYMDMSFFEELRTKFGAEGGDFAVAYVVAHEYGHHIQTILGTSDKVRQLQSTKSEVESNKLSVSLELQADFYAGLWTHYTENKYKMLEAGDIQEALSAANAVGDDAIQKKMQGQVVPDSFTHGTSEQRIYWFKKGYESGNISLGDTFSAIN